MKHLKSFFNGLLLIFLFIFCFSFGNFAQAQTRVAEKMSDGTLIINTDSLSGDVIGFISKVPLKITIKNDVIQKVEALPNQETPGYFQPVKEKLLPVWKGMTIKEGLNAKVDVISGATYSSRAVIENVKRGLTYAQKMQSKQVKMGFEWILPIAIALVAICITMVFVIRRKKIKQ